MDSTDQDTTFRVDMKFTKGNVYNKVYAMGERSEYHNYYLGHMTYQSERTSIANTVIKSGAYTNTDVIYTHSPSGFRHWIVARSGAPTADFEMTFAGHDTLYIDGSGKLIIGTTIGNITYTKAKAYTLNHTTGVLTLLGWQPSYSISGSAVSFTSYGSWSGTLVLEFGEVVQNGGGSIENVELEWSTYFGGSDDDELHGIIGDDLGNCWTTGRTRSDIFPLLPGSLILNSFSESGDVIVAAFDQECSASWMTYYGGTEQEIPSSIDRDGEENLYIAGGTESSDFPDVAGGGLDDSSLGGVQDGFIFQLDASGFSVLDSYIGGDGIENVSDIAVSTLAGQSAIYLVGSSTSDNSTFPNVNLNGSYQQDYAGGPTDIIAGDAFIMRLDYTTNETIWKTFFGSEEADYGFNIKIAANDIFLSGATRVQGYSSTQCAPPTDGLFPRCVSEFFWTYDQFENNNGNYNSYIAEFDGSTNQLIWSTIVCPSTQFVTIGIGYNYSLDMATWTNAGSELYLTGECSSFDEETFPFLTSENPEGYNQQTGINTAVFLIQFKVTGTEAQLFWSTWLDGSGHQAGNAIALTPNQTVYLAGNGDMNEVPDISDWCQTPTDDAFPICNSTEESYMETNISSPTSRSFIAGFSKYNVMQWSSLFGNYFRNETHDMYCAGDYIYICGSADEPQGSEDSWTIHQYDELASTDYYQSTHSGDTDGTITRFKRVIVEEPVNMDELTSEKVLSIYPVPADDLLNVLLPTYLHEQSTIEVMDALGQLVLTIRPTSELATIDIAALASGQYIVRYTTANGTWTKGFVK
ncbi:MAG: T9SS type A sorting domain-containing protein [Flavobacteriales bacterium]